MAIVKTLQGQDLVSRLSQFFAMLSSDQKCHPVFGEPNGMCEEGKKLFDVYCENNHDSSFLEHINPNSKGEIHCKECNDSFWRYIFLITEGN